MVDVSSVSVDVAARDGQGHVVADEASGARGAEACHYGRGHVTAVEGVASMEVASQTAASDVAVEKAVEGGKGRGLSPRRPWDECRGRRPCRRGCAAWRWGMSHRRDEAAGWLRCYRCERRWGMLASCCRGASAALSLAREPLRFCRRSRRTCRYLHIKLHTLGSTQLGVERAKLL